MPAHRARLARAARARGDDEILCAVANGIDEPGHQIAAIRAVAVHEDDYSAVRRRGGGPRGAGAPVTAVLRQNHPSSGRARQIDRSVAAAAIDDDDLPGQIARDLSHDVGDRLLLVQNRNDDRDG
jgi:hypothetical protein